MTEADEIADSLLAKYGPPAGTSEKEVQEWMTRIWPTALKDLGHTQKANVEESVALLVRLDRLG